MTDTRPTFALDSGLSGLSTLSYGVVGEEPSVMEYDRLSAPPIGSSSGSGRRINRFLAAAQIDKPATCRSTGPLGLRIKRLDPIHSRSRADWAE